MGFKDDVLKGDGIEPAWKRAEQRLTPAQVKHLGELVEIADAGHGEAHWQPSTPGEWRCAEALARRGFLSLNVSGWRRFSLTVIGREALAQHRSHS